MKGKGNVKKEDVCTPSKEINCPLREFCSRNNPACVMY